MKKKMIKVSVEFADHITESDTFEVIYDLKVKIAELGKDIYPRGLLKSVDDMEWNAHLRTKGCRDVVFEMVNTKKNKFEVEYTTSGSITEKGGEIHILSMTMLMGMGVQLYGNDGEGMPLSKAWNNINIEAVYTAIGKRCVGTYRKDGSISLIQIIRVHYSDKEN